MRRSTTVPGGRSAVLTLFLVLATAAAAPAGDRFSVEVSLERNELEMERRELRRELKGIEQEIGEAEEPVSVSGTVSRAHVVHDLRSKHLDRLRSQRQRLLDRIRSVDRRFEKLTRRVVAHYDERPPWWNDIDG